MKQETTASDRIYEEYMAIVDSTMWAWKPREALALLTEIMDRDVSNPLVFSFHGYLNASVNKNFTEGINTCWGAFDVLRGLAPDQEKYFQPILYLNLGKAYLVSGRKKEAITAFRNGLRIDPESKDLLKEMKRLGVRKNPPFPFLSRSNSLNKYLGKILHFLAAVPR
ncbi:MAG TPA: tetratricopeptide repeat protein [Thermodesulfovibrionales bacterium]|nr:tetratricopeptide repeat protein [Thermodesulfovibrionales bacterium]